MDDIEPEPDDPMEADLNTASVHQQHPLACGLSEQPAPRGSSIDNATNDQSRDISAAHKASHRIDACDTFSSGTQSNTLDNGTDNSATPSYSASASRSNVGVTASVPLTEQTKAVPDHDNNEAQAVVDMCETASSHDSSLPTRQLDNIPPLQNERIQDDSNNARNRPLEHSSYDYPVSYPYTEGNTLHLHVTSSFDPKFPAKQTIDAKVTKVVRPSTMSVVVFAKIVNSSPEQEVVIKLYDRRFVDSLRSTYNNGDEVDKFEYSEYRATKARQYFCHADASDFVQKWESDRLDEVEGLQCNEEEEYQYSELQKEAELHCISRLNFHDEVKFYQKFPELQGCFIPKLFASVWIHIDQPPGFDTSDANADLNDPEGFFRASALIIEKIDGFCLDNTSEITEIPSRNNLNELAGQIVRILAYFGRHRVRLSDFAWRNCMVRVASHNATTKWYPVLIDFSHYDKQDELSENDWVPLINDFAAETGFGIRARLFDYGCDYDVYADWFNTEKLYLPPSTTLETDSS